MKANLYSIVLLAGAMISSVNAFAQPTASAPTPPELAKSKVISIYSDAYASTGFDFGVWGSGSTYALEKIGGTDNVAKFTTTDLGYFGWQFSKVNTAAMDKLHVDIYSDAAFSVRVVPITGGTEVGQTIEVSAGKWTSVDLDTKVFADGGANLANVYQIKFDNVKSQTFYIDNVYFWSTSTDVDTEAPAWVSDPTAVANSTSATISVNANDNVSTTLTYEVSQTADFATVEATVNGKANGTTEIALKGLSPETNYTYYVRVKDMAGNVGDVKTVTFTTTEAPALEEVTYYGIAGGSDKANWINTVDGYFPTIEYSATTTAYNQIVFKIKLSEIGKNLTTPELWCDQLPAPMFVGMTKVEGTTNEFTATLFDENEKTREDRINFRFRFPMDGGAPMTQNIYMKVGDSNAKPSEDTTVPTWGSDPVAQNVTDKTAEIVVNVKDDSGSAFITLTGDNGFAEVKKTVKADGTDQTIALNGLTANTKYNLTLAIADAAGNAGVSKTVNFTTLEAPDLEPLYLTIPIASKDWNNEAYNPNGSMLITVNPDNTLSFKVSLDQDREDFEETNMYVHGVEEPVSLIRTSEGVYECTTTKSISNRDALVHFHMYFRFSDGNSTFAVKNFKPSEGSTSAVAEVEAEAAKVVAANGVIRVEGDKTFAVYTVAGQLAFRGMGEVRLDKGVYVVVVDGKAQKVML